MRTRVMAVMTVVLAIALGLLLPPAQPLQAQAQTRGVWATLPYTLPLNPVHVTLMKNGRVLIVAGSGNDEQTSQWRGAVWAPELASIVPHSLAWDMFCNGMIAMQDGRIFINGGNLEYDPFIGEKKSSVYDPSTGFYSDLPNMAHGRWYPTVTMLGDGRIMTFSGLGDTGGTNSTVEIYSEGSGWSQEYASPFTPDLYPRLLLLPNGKVFYAGSLRQSRTFDPATNTWSGVIATTQYGGSRGAGTSVLLPLTPANAYKPSVMIFGGSNPATATTELIDLSLASPQWQNGPAMSQPRNQMNATILPNGKILATGGSRNDDIPTASLQADLYDPATNTFSSAGSNLYPRVYHSNALLLPDATVALLGGNPQRRSYENRIEIYSPAYLFAANGTPAVRPRILGAPANINYGAPFTVQTDNPSAISSVVLIRPGSPTHAFDMDQRMVGLVHSSAGGALTVTGPPTGNIAPPGYYMLFLLDSAGVPSVATFVRLSSGGGTATGNIGVTSIGATPDIGDSNYLNGSRVTTTGGGTLKSMSVYVGAIDSNTARRQYQLAVYSDSGNRPGTLIATSASGTLAANAWNTANITATLQAGTSYWLMYNTNGSNENVNNMFFSNGAQGQGTFSTSSVAFGTWPTTFPSTMTTAVYSIYGTFNSTQDFTIAATPATQSVVRGASTTFTVNIAALSGFSGSTSLSMSGLPAGASATFAPTSVNGTGASTVTITTSASTPGGSFPLTITGTSGSLVHTAGTTLVVQAPDFSVAASPATRTIAAGSSTTYTVTVGAISGFTGSVTLSATGQPAGSTATFSPTSILTSGTSTLTVATAAGSNPGTFTIAVKGASGTLERTVNVGLTVQAPDFTVTATPSSRTIPVGTSTTYAVTVSPVNGFTGTVTFGATGLPAGTTATFSPAFVTTSGQSTVTITTSGSTTPAGSFTLGLSGTGATLTRTANVGLVTQTPDFTMAVSPANRSVIPGASTTFTVTAAAVNGFSGSIGLSVTGLPAGVTPSFVPATLTGGAGTSTLTLTTLPTSPLGNSNLTIAGTSGSLTRTAGAALVLGTATGGTIGVTTIGAAQDDNNSNHLNGSKVTTTSGVTLTSMSVYVGAIDSNTSRRQFRLAIYQDNGGRPGTLLASSAQGNLTANAWNTATIAATLLPNTTYWFLYNTNGGTATVNNMYYTNGAQGQGVYSTNAVTFGTWPSTFPASTLTPSGYSINGTFVP